MHLYALAKYLLEILINILLVILYQCSHVIGVKCTVTGLWRLCKYLDQPTVRRYTYIDKDPAISYVM